MSLPVGNMNISINAKSNMSLDSLIRYNPQVKPGGKWSPQDCSARFHVALIIPYRYRWNHLKLLLSVLHPMLRRQKMSYQVFVAEQASIALCILLCTIKFHFKRWFYFASLNLKHLFSLLLSSLATTHLTKDCL